MIFSFFHSILIDEPSKNWKLEKSTFGDKIARHINCKVYRLRSQIEDVEVEQTLKDTNNSFVIIGALLL